MSFSFRLSAPVLAGALASAAFAGVESDAPVQMAPFDTTGTRFTLTAPSLDEARADLARTPGGSEVIDATRYERGRASTVNDLFALSPGVFAQTRFGSDEARLSIRGSGLQRTFHGRGLRVLQDGVPLNLADGSFDMQAFELLAARYVSVWRGANALAYGASTLGGAIEFVSPTGRDGTTGVRVEAGSFDYLRAAASVAVARDRTDAFAVLTRTAQTGFRAHARQQNARFFANAGLALTPALETRFYLTAVTTSSELPGALFKAELAAGPRAANPVTAAQNQKRDFDLLRAASKTTLRAGDNVWDLTAAWTYKDLDHPISPVVDQLSNDQLVALTVTRVNDLAGHANRLKAGVMWTRGDTHAASFVNANGTRGPLTALARTFALNNELWAEDQLTLGRRVTLVAGLTAAQNRRRNDQALGGAGSSTRTYHNVSPKLGLRYDAADAQFFANVSGSYEPPSFSETGALAAPNRAQRAVTVELGSRGAAGPLRWDAAVYHARLRDEFLSLNDAHGNPLGTINAPRTLHSGLELGVETDLLGSSWNATPAQRLVARVAWTYGRFRFDGDPVYHDHTLAGFPPHLVRGELTWEHRQGWYAGPTFEWVPQRAPVDFAHTLFADAYALCGFRLGRRRARGCSWFIEARNLANTPYAATTGVIADARGLDVRQFFPGDGRSVYAGIDRRW